MLDWVESGEEVLITRHGKAGARLVPAESGFNRAKARQAAREEMLSTGKGFDVNEVHVYLKARISGNNHAKPKARSWQS